jgi:hypothetical protein
MSTINNLESKPFCFGNMTWQLYSKKNQLSNNITLELYLKRIHNNPVDNKQVANEFTILVISYAVKINGVWYHQEVQINALIFEKKDDLLLCALSNKNLLLKETDNDFQVSIKLEYIYSGLLNFASQNLASVIPDRLFLKTLSISDLWAILMSLPEQSTKQIQHLNFIKCWSKIF